ncbi:uncharacterized protein LOC128672729 [Plodia interpunctella]|uniref:uncharacterized protein LOC128672401 n=1 Tax=Plodia interpunctella TaxID=58824 RepID=UPI0023682044|nr:uncharacterized protein LOC128672401 [Plodia interpunctella]XP_053606045.1 uncharacterized protein LOC128672729 [Plodia interpunctella]
MLLATMKIQADLFVLFIVFIFKSTTGQSNDRISADYYFGVGVLRTRENPNPCKNSEFQILCHMKCGGDHICMDGKCYCLTALTTKKMLIRGAKTETDKEDSGEVSDYESEDEDEIDFTKKEIKSYSKERKDDSQLERRHQIAHFCSNLSLARKCIYKCMEQGKPAFCGKDHVCYCGHTETHSHATGVEGHHDTYAEFKDMYNKYVLGRGYDVPKEHD